MTRRGRQLLALLLGAAPALAVAAGCSIGKGTGVVQGQMQVSMCRREDGRPVDQNGDFDLDPDFFVGEPIDSPDPLFFSNQLLIRIQHSGVRLEVADALAFYIVDLYEAGRCIRDRRDPVTGQDDWNPAMCERSPEGTTRVLVGTEAEAVRGFLLLNHTCPGASLPNSITVPVSADALGTCDLGSCPTVDLCPARGSWVRFTQLGSLPTNPAVPLDRGFRVNFDEHIAAGAPETPLEPAILGFHVELCDARTVRTRQKNIVPVPAPRMQGVLEGRFEFELQRGQAGQPFP